MTDMTPDRDERTRNPAWMALGQMIVSRRVALGMRTREAFAAKAEISSKILGEIERGDRTSYDPATLAAVEQTLQWPAGEVRRILRGGREVEGGPLSVEIGPPLSTLLWLTSPQSPLSETERGYLLAILQSVADRWTPLA